MYRTLRAVACGLLALASVVGCSAGTTEVVTQEDPESMRLKQEMLNKFSNQQQVNKQMVPQAATPETPAPQQ